jgi:hypothetical protein
VLDAAFVRERFVFSVNLVLQRRRNQHQNPKRKLCPTMRCLPKFRCALRQS